jgi:hypothetical protein
MADEQNSDEDVFDRWAEARRALDHALDEFAGQRGSTTEVFLRVAELRRSEELAWAALRRQAVDTTD